MMTTNLILCVLICFTIQVRGKSLIPWSNLEDDLELLGNKLKSLKPELFEVIHGLDTNMNVGEHNTDDDVISSVGDDCSDGLLYKDQCIRLAYTIGYGVNHDKANDECNGKLVEITSDDMYKAVNQYVNQTWVKYLDFDRPFVYVWLGMTYDTSDYPDKVVTLPNGNKVDLSEWQATYPSDKPEQVNIMMRINDDGDFPELTGLSNTQPTFSYGVPLCHVY